MRKVATNRDDFEYWLADMDDALDRFIATLPASLRGRLDYSPASLDALEAWILERYPTTQAMLAPSEAQVVDGLARYVGETIRKNIGGKWDIRLDDPKYAFYGLPQLTGFGPRSTPEAPITLATAAADRREGNYIRSVFDGMREQYRR
jgi:hypothetical protein